ncbi:MAG: hypothetical protein Q8L45_12520 [Xanthomonadaceae bacterium]|nr:hypothetical protein [Xanthomonadaceae bacterium]MDP2184541.1 hypothetical protein [Xanthomonadales bacterium]MDZ4115074.1 hypothetical protein [Xanthomonadaceae bacterium]MDZ4377504.1 hypothetical protein [Xanthomonadaceae bacterium]
MPTELSAAAGFVDKWLQREPAFVQASLFVAPAQRVLFAHWGALLFCLREAAFELSDPSLRVAKSSWWAQELLALAQGNASHPLANQLLEHAGAPWAALSMALLQAASHSDQTALDTDAAITQMQPLAAAMVAVEAALLGGEADCAATRWAALHLLSQRLLVGQATDDAGRIPLQLQARFQVSRSAIREGTAAAAVAGYAQQLLLAAPAGGVDAPLFRRMQWLLDRAVLKRLASGQPAPARPGMLSLWRLWRAARQGR